MDYRPAPAGTPTPPYVAPYETLVYQLDELAGTINPVIQIDTSGGVIGVTFTTAAPGLYNGIVLSPNPAPIVGYMISNAVGSIAGSPTYISALWATISGNFAITVTNPATGLFSSNWQFLQLTLFIQN